MPSTDEENLERRLREIEADIMGVAHAAAEAFLREAFGGPGFPRREAPEAIQQAWQVAQERIQQLRRLYRDRQDWDQIDWDSIPVI